MYYDSAQPHLASKQFLLAGKVDEKKSAVLVEELMIIVICFFFISLYDPHTQWTGSYNLSLCV